MATFDYPADLVGRIPYPAFQGPRLRIDSRVAAVSEEEDKQLPVSSSKQGIKDSLFREIESGAKLGRNPLAGAGALALQLLVLLAVIVIPLYHTEILPKRETLTMLYLVPPAAAPIGTTLRTPTPKSTYTATSSSIPAPVHTTQEAPPTPVGTSGGVIGGVPGGMVGGVPGGLLSAILSSTRSMPVTAKIPEPTPVKRVRVASRIVEANLIHDVTPQYPPEAGRERIEGTVVLMAVIGKDGTVQDVHVVSGLPLLAQAAIDAVKQWRYKPYMIDGEPVEVDSRITINFALSGGRNENGA